MSFLKKMSFGKKANTETHDSAEPMDGIEAHGAEIGESVATASETNTDSVLGTADLSAESIVVSEMHAPSFIEEPKPKKSFFDMFKKKPKASSALDAAEMAADLESASASAELDEAMSHEIQSAADPMVSMETIGVVEAMPAPSYDYSAETADAAEQSYSDVIVPSDEADSQQYVAHTMSSDRESEIILEIGEKPVALPGIGKMPAKTQYTISFGLLVASLALTGGLAGAGFLKASEYQGRAEVGTRLQMLTQRILATTQYAISGSKESITRLKESRSDVDAQFETLLKGNETLSAMALADNAHLASANTILVKEVTPLVDQVVKIAAGLGALVDNDASLNKAANSAYIAAEQLASLLQSNGSPDIHVAAADHLRVLAERLRRNGSNLLTSNDISVEPVAEYTSDYRSLKGTIDALTNGDTALGMPAVTDPQARAILGSMNPSVIDIAKVADFFDKNATSLVTARRNLKTLALKSEDALAESAAFSQEMREVSQDAYGTVYLSGIFAVLALASLALIGLVNNRATRMEAWDSAFKNKRNEKDIIDFMEACLPLELGNLTVRFNTNMEAMEGVTGGIRNSVNEAVISLNDAVGTVKRTAEDVSSVVTQSVQSTTEMKDSNERQSKEINDVENLVAGLTKAIGEVTERTLDAARATESARSASQEGAIVVAQTNEKMGVIRANMQEVLKSVKHLGETSHEIGDIVSTIEQITDRTQVLAVNASLEAAKAGAAGAGFQIIAGEVNRLAEQSAEALRTITALVQRVQGETGVAIRVVEESTNNVVEGARLSAVANTQLETISKLAVDLSSIMEEIRAQSENQTTSAHEVRVSMERLATLSREFQSQVVQVVGGVQQIDTSMVSLKNTVSIFTTEKAEAD